MLVVDIYPRSLLRLILLGKGLVVLPLLLAIAYSMYMLQHMADDAETAMQESAQILKMNWEIPEELGHMERALRQFELLGDRSLLADYDETREEWRHSAIQYLDFPALADIGAQMLQLMELEREAYEQLQNGQKRAADLRPVIADLRSRTIPLLEATSVRLENKRVEFREHSESLRQRLWLGQLVSLALALGLLVFWRRLLARLLAGVERAVQLLGAGHLDEEIHLRGPDDIQGIGRRLDWLRRRLQAFEQQRNQMLRHVSHELKTPLAALREGASLLSEGAAGPLSAAQARIADILQGNSIRLQELIDNLLKLQQAGYVGDRFEPRPVRLDQLLLQRLETHQLVAQKKQLRIRQQILPGTVDGGEEELRALVDNLLANAIKFTPDGGDIDISLHQEGDGVLMDVVDSGPGIRPEDRQRIFEPFFRAQATRQVAGTGLGLAIAREYALAHRGGIEVLETDRGAHFRLSLPVTWEGVT